MKHQPKSNCADFAKYEHFLEDVGMVYKIVTGTSIKKLIHEDGIRPSIEDIIDTLSSTQMMFFITAVAHLQLLDHDTPKPLKKFFVAHKLMKTYPAAFDNQYINDFMHKQCGKIPEGTEFF